MRRKRLRHIEQKKISRECWDLDSAFMEWLRPRLKTYLREADKIVDLEFDKFKLYGVEKTQKEVIERMIELLDLLMDENIDHSLYWNDPVAYVKYQKELCDWWGEVMPAMWW